MSLSADCYDHPSIGLMYSITRIELWKEGVCCPQIGVHFHTLTYGRKFNTECVLETPLFFFFVVLSTKWLLPLGLEVDQSQLDFNHLYHCIDFAFCSLFCFFPPPCCLSPAV